MSNFKCQIANNISFFNWRLSSGFTLIEMLLVFTIIGTLTAAGLSAFFSYSSSQTFNTAVSDVSHTLNQLKSRAIAYVKPSQCGAATLEGYEFWYPTSGTYYRVSVRCGGTYHVLSQTNLPTNVTFGTSRTVFFRVATGTIAAPVTINITGNGKTSTILVEATGVVSVQ